MIRGEILYGYPEETRADFLKSMRYVPGFDEVDILKYSPLPGTKGQTLCDTISQTEKIWRYRYLLDLREKLAARGLAKVFLISDGRPDAS